MKKLALILGIVSLVAACNTIEEPSNIQDKTQEVKQVANAPVLSASIEEAAETKSYLNEADWRILWTANDEISAFVSNTANWKYQFDGATGAQKGSFNPVSGSTPSGGTPIANVYAVYPYSASNTIDANGVMTVNFPAAQTYAAKTFGQGANTMVAVGDDIESDLVFKNACGYLMFKLYGSNVNVKSVSLKGNNNEKIAGAATVSMPLGGEPTVTMASSATNEIVLTCTNAVTIGNSSSNYTEFWFAVPPVTFTQGFTITVKTDNGGIFFKKANISNFEVERGKAKKMAPFEVKPLTNLGAVETANCYIVNTAGTINQNGYCFDCTIAGNGQTVDWASVGFVGAEYQAYPTGGGSTLATSSSVYTKFNQNNCISDLRIENGMICFKASGAEGNAKVVLDDVWVWLIWCTDQPGTVSFTNNGTTFSVMDRNIGAITNVADASNVENMYGLYYQFGNPIGYTKAEFATADLGGYRMKDAWLAPSKPHLQNPQGDWLWFRTAYWCDNAKPLFGLLWGGGSDIDGTSLSGNATVKTMYDPCPPGYKVSPYDVFHGIVNSNNNGDVNGMKLTGNGGEIYFPYNGCMWQGDYVNWLLPGPYIPEQDNAARVCLWTSRHTGTTMAWPFWIYSKASNRAGGGCMGEEDKGGSILVRGMGVRCVVE